MDMVQAEELSEEIEEYEGVKITELVVVRGNYVVRVLGLDGEKVKIFESFEAWIVFVESRKVDLDLPVDTTQ
jgi:hypothetical protein